MAVTTWNYGGLEVEIERAPERVSALTTLLGIAGLVVAPTAASGWALLHWFPLSLPIGVTIAGLAWIGIIATAADDEPA
jgi:hypothetical protein